jgi:replicative DNA helicase
MDKLYNIDMEKIVLGILLNDNSKFAKISSILDEKHFFCELHQIIYKNIKSIILQGDVADSRVILRYIEGYKELEGKEVSYLNNISVASLGNTAITSYTRILIDLYQKRYFKEVIDNNFAKIYEPNTNIVELINNINKQFNESFIATDSNLMVGYRENLLETLQDFSKQEEDLKTSTGFKLIDKLLEGGFERGRTYCLAGAPKAGKTQFLTTITNNIRKTGKRIAYICAEMSPREIQNRMVAGDVDLKSEELKKFNKEKNITDKLQNYFANLQTNENCFFVKSERIKLDDLKTQISKAVANKNCEGIILDYLQLVQVNNKNNTIAQNQEEVAQTLAEYSKKYNIWILYASQINRDGQIRNGAGIEQACDWAYEINKNESNEIYLKPIVSRHTAGYSIGSETNRVFRIAEKGTHIVENNIEEKYSYQ